MFLCKKCHDKRICHNPFCEVALEGGMGASYGKCEECGKVGICTDCKVAKYERM